MERRLFQENRPGRIRESRKTADLSIVLIRFAFPPSPVSPSKVSNGFKQLGGKPGAEGSELILTAGQPIGKGLSAKAAEQLGLAEGTPVGSGVIDAYAGWVGTVGAPMPGLEEASQPSLEESKHRLAAIAGTSTCHIVQSPDPVFVPGVWGPYLHPVFPGCESGQTISHRDVG